MALFNVRIVKTDDGKPTMRQFNGDDVHAAIAYGETIGKVTEVSQVLAKVVTTLEIL